MNPDSSALVAVSTLGERQEEMARLDRALEYLARRTPARTTTLQMLAFMRVARACAGGRSVTLKEVMGESDGLLLHHLNRSFATFLPADARVKKRTDDDDRLGWVFQADNPQDARRKDLRLTQVGIEIAEALANIMYGKAV